MSQNYYSKKISGFSSIELIVGISIFLMVGLAIWAFQRDIFSSNNIMSNSLLVQQQMRSVLKTMGSEIRSISPSSVGSYPIAQASPTLFTFYSDIDDDGLKEQIRYFIDGSVLKKGTLKPSGNPLSYNPTNEQVINFINDVANGETLLFSYYDTNYDGITDPLSNPINILNVRLVKITIIIDSSVIKLPGPVTMTTQISIRNLKDNL